MTEFTYAIADLPDRIAKRITVEWRLFVLPEPCWTSTYAPDGKGYCPIWWEGRLPKAHRLVYKFLKDQSIELMPGRSGDSEVMNHICRNTRCCNPTHLEIVTNRENIAAGKRSALGEFTSKHVGVSWSKRRSKWKAQIMVGGKRRYLGHFAEEAAAADAYKDALERATK